MQTDCQAGMPTGRHVGRQAGRLAGRPADRQTDIHNYSIDEIALLVQAARSFSPQIGRNLSYERVKDD